jgi:hypothetical protein
MLRLRATTGQTGNQQLGSVTSSSVFTFLPGGTVFGSGLSISSLGNPNIDWQKTTTSNVAMDVALFDHRFTGTFEVYQKRTKPLVASVDQPPSSGVNSYSMSFGELTYRGFEFEGTYAVIRQRHLSWRMRLMGTMFRGEYSGFTDKLESMNQAAQENQSLIQFKDGYSPKTLWAVRSLGIDPATGREVFWDRNGMPTFVYNPADIVAIGRGEPTMSGTISNFLTYKQFTLTLIMRYSFGEKIFNSALYNKVENISMNQVADNQDRRALTHRWVKPGDITQFKGISLTSSTPMSSRFIQTENYLSGESIGLMWRLDKHTYSWLRDMGMESVMFNLTAQGTGGVFRLSNVKRERGTSYPEATTISLSVNAVF